MPEKAAEVNPAESQQVQEKEVLKLIKQPSGSKVADTAEAENKIKNFEWPALESNP